MTTLFLVTVTSVIAQNRSESSLPRASLAERFPSQAADAFFNAVQSKNMDLHSIMILKNGKVTFERWFGENAPGKLHVLWSVSKTWSSMAIGFAVTENRLSVNDKVISFFPNDLPETISENLAKLSIKDLLTMSVGHASLPVGMDRNATERWEKIFLAHPIVYTPGTVFMYNTNGSHMLSSIIQTVTGEKLFDYLKPRLFVPLGIEGARWDETHQGLNFGDIGLRIKTEDMAKFGLLLLQKGKWNGKQVISEAWIEEATTRKIPKDEPPESDRNMSQGYGYQIWRCKHNSFLAFGNGGQFIIVLPDQNAVVALTGDIEDIQTELTLFWEHIFPSL